MSCELNLIFHVDRDTSVAISRAAFPSLMILAGSSSLRLSPESYIYWKGYLGGKTKSDINERALLDQSHTTLTVSYTGVPLDRALVLDQWLS